MIDETVQDAAVEQSPVPPAEPVSPHRDGFLVLGMHRSGTSAIAGTLVKLGAAAPRTLMAEHPDNLKGYWESLPITQLHDALLASAGSRWNDWRPFNAGWFETPAAAQFKAQAKALLASEFDGAPAFVLKDPRICRFAPFWLDIFAVEGITPRLILPVRQPLEVAQSLQARDGFALSEGLLLWLRHVLDAEATTRSMSRVVVCWADFLVDWRKEASRVTDVFGAQWSCLNETVAGETDDFLQPDLKHRNVSTEAARHHPDMHAWAMVVYDAMLELARDPASPGARESLDDIRARFEEASSLFGSAAADRERYLEGVRHELALAQQAKAEAEQQIHVHVQALDQERAQRAALQQTHEAALQAAAATASQAGEHERARLAIALAERDARIQHLLRVHDDVVSVLQNSLKTERDQSEQEIAAASGSANGA